MAFLDKAEHEVKRDDEAAEDTTHGAKKGKKGEKGGNSKGRRTKTGCMTCRKRRVKCDEAKPTCRNCDKSRRQCAGYQPPGGRQSTQLSQHTPDGFPYQHVPEALPAHNMFYPPQTPFSDAAPEYFQQQVFHRQPLAYSQPGEEWSMFNENFAMQNSAQWSPSQESWQSVPMTSSHQNYGMDVHTGATPVMQFPAYSPYPGRPPPQTVATYFSPSHTEATLSSTRA